MCHESKLAPCDNSSGYMESVHHFFSTVRSLTCCACFVAQTFIENLAKAEGDGRRSVSSVHGENQLKQKTYRILFCTFRGHAQALQQPYQNYLLGNPVLVICSSNPTDWDCEAKCLQAVNAGQQCRPALEKPPFSAEAQTLIAAQPCIFSSFFPVRNAPFFFSPILIVSNGATFFSTHKHMFFRRRNTAVQQASHALHVQPGGDTVGLLTIT